MAVKVVEREAMRSASIRRRAEQVVAIALVGLVAVLGGGTAWAGGSPRVSTPLVTTACRADGALVLTYTFLNEDTVAAKVALTLTGTAEGKVILPPPFILAPGESRAVEIATPSMVNGWGSLVTTFSLPDDTNPKVITAPPESWSSSCTPPPPANANLPRVPDAPPPPTTSPPPVAVSTLAPPRPTTTTAPAETTTTAAPDLTAETVPEPSPAAASPLATVAPVTSPIADDEQAVAAVPASTTSRMPVVGLILVVLVILSAAAGGWVWQTRARRR